MFSERVTLFTYSWHLFDVVSKQTTAIVEAETIERLIEYNHQLAKTVQRDGFQL
ncbi:hypothetical protein [Aliagarivorans marinus]|uniref:hypothetical protein n=1 Tax=Aliagarivorans marinus TaxID=561965 RepID=UPI00040FF652|nr:hypothetical protein [Aliagarivorans marinus]